MRVVNDVLAAKIEKYLHMSKSYIKKADNYLHFSEKIETFVVQNSRYLK